MNIHQWSYGRLIDNIRSQASKLNIVVEEGKQLTQGSSQEQAKALAFSVYHSRLTA